MFARGLIRLVPSIIFNFIFEPASFGFVVAPASHRARIRYVAFFVGADRPSSFHTYK